MRPRQQIGPPSRHGKWKPATNTSMAELPDLAWVGVCRGCKRTYVSAVKAFPSIYRCPNCTTPADSERKKRYDEFIALRPRCANGHLLTEHTSRMKLEGGFVCKICNSASAARSRAKEGETP